MLVFCLLLIFTSAVVSVCLVQYISEEMLFLPPMSRPESPLFQNSENQERGGGLHSPSREGLLPFSNQYFTSKPGLLVTLMLPL